MTDTVEVYLPRQSKPVLLDTQDFCNVWQRRNWGVYRGWHVQQGHIRTGRNGTSVDLAALIMHPVPPLMVDHINRNPFDNRRVNFRIATKAQNTQNKGKTSTQCSSRFKGVCWDVAHQKWRASICPNRRTRYLGLFADERAAAQAYNDAALRHFGEFAQLNVLT